MVESIVRSTDRTVRVPPAILIGIGAISATVTGLIQARQMGLDVPPDAYVQPSAWILMIATIGIVAWRGRGASRETLLDRYTGAAFLAAFAMALTLTVTAQHRVVSPEGIGLVWAGSFGMALLITGAMGSRVLLVGGFAMLVAVGGASFVADWLPGVLAVAWLVGFVIPGVVLARGLADGRSSTL
jgi:hypothetical protein